MKIIYNKYWGNIANISQLLYFGIIFNPRYNLRYVKWLFNDIYDDKLIFASPMSPSLNTIGTNQHLYNKIDLDSHLLVHLRVW